MSWKPLLAQKIKREWRAMAKPGAKPKLDLGDRVLVALEYWREYGALVNRRSAGLFIGLKTT
jgi:hypothetical protein